MRELLPLKLLALTQQFRLKKKLDENWFEGELGGKVGMFPVDYVDVVVALP